MAWVLVPGAGVSGECFSNGGHWYAEPVGDGDGVGVPVLWGSGGGDRGGLVGRHCGPQVVGAFGDHHLGHRAGVVEEGGEGGRAAGGEQVGGGRRPSGEGGAAGVDAVGGELPVVAFGADVAGEVGVGGDDDVGVAGQEGGVVGQCSARGARPL